MIKATDLKLGNWILDRNIPVQVTMLSIGMNFYCINGVNLDKKTGKVIEGEGDPDRFAGIKLWSEELEACGFIIPKGSSVHRLTIGYDDTPFPCTLQRTGDGVQVCRSGVGAMTAPVKYVHELQNLFHSLTGNELSYHPSSISEKTE